MNAESQSLSLASDQNLVKTVSEKYTNVKLLPSLVVALVGGSASIALAYLLKNVTPHFYSLVMERGIIQFLTIYAFWFTAGMLIFKCRNLKKERCAFELDYIKSFTAGHDVLGTKTILDYQQAIEEDLNPQEKDLILINRINKAVKQLRINRNPADVANILKTVAETDAAVVDSSYILIKFMIWAIPVLGFIGTIMGMTQAIGSFDTVLKGISEVGFAGVKDSLGLVTSGLAVAFETTFLALVLSALVNLFSNALQKREEDLLSDVEEFTTDNIINKYSTLRDKITSSLQGPGVSQEPKAGSKDIVRELKNMNKQHQVNADQMMEQVGRAIEAIQAMTRSGDEESPQDQPADNLAPLLKEIGEVLKGQAAFIQEMKEVSAFVKQNMETMQKLPAAVEEMNETSRKLGDLFSKIYNRSFA